MPTNKIHEWEQTKFKGVHKCRACHVIRATSSQVEDNIWASLRAYGYSTAPYAYSHNGYWYVYEGKLVVEWILVHWHCNESPLSRRFGNESIMGDTCET